jgi:hypothetical protein
MVQALFKKGDYRLLLNFGTDLYRVNETSPESGKLADKQLERKVAKSKEPQEMPKRFAKKAPTERDCRRQ